MTHTQTARRQYNMMNQVTGSEKSIELKMFSEITTGLRTVKLTDNIMTPENARFLTANLELWDILLTDLVHPENHLPDMIKKNLISLCKFTRQHTHKIMQNEASVDVLIDINMDIINGIKQSMMRSDPVEAITERIV